MRRRDANEEAHQCNALFRTTASPLVNTTLGCEILRQPIPGHGEAKTWMIATDACRFLVETDGGSISSYSRECVQGATHMDGSSALEHYGICKRALPYACNCPCFCACNERSPRLHCCQSSHQSCGPDLRETIIGHRSEIACANSVFLSRMRYAQYERTTS